MIAPATVQFYDVVLFVHITAVVLAFGPGFGYAIVQAIAERHDPRSIPTVMRGFSTIDRFLLTPAALVVIAAGIYLTIDRWSFGDVYISFGIAAIIVLLGMCTASSSPTSAGWPRRHGGTSQPQATARSL